MTFSKLRSPNVLWTHEGQAHVWTSQWPPPREPTLRRKPPSDPRFPRWNPNLRSNPFCGNSWIKPPQPFHQPLKGDGVLLQKANNKWTGLKKACPEIAERVMPNDCPVSFSVIPDLTKPASYLRRGNPVFLPSSKTRRSPSWSSEYS